MTAVADRVAALVAGFRDHPIGALLGIADIAVSPDGSLVAFAGEVVADGGVTAHRIAIADVASHLHRVTDHSGRCPAWSADGGALAWVDSDAVVVAPVTAAGSATARFASARFASGGQVPTPQSARREQVEGVAEWCAWSTAGRVVVGVAAPGAERSDVHGSGRVAPVTGEPWSPTVEEGAATSAGRRTVWQLTPGTGALKQISPSDLNVWEAAPTRAGLVAIVSSGPTESDWYGADLVAIDAAANVRRLLAPGTQLAGLTTNPAGTHAAVVCGTMSDRGITTGELVVVDVGTGTVTPVAVPGVDVTAAAWTGDGALVAAGVSSLTTVAVGVTVGGPADVLVERLVESAEAWGDYLPVVTARASTVAVVAHSYERPPTLSVLGDATTVPLVRVGTPGTSRVANAGSIEAVTWAARDGAPIDGLLVTPRRPGPHPLVVNVHGGPVWAWRDAYSMQGHSLLTPLLAELGYAVLHPNARSSSGRGQQFVLDGLLDMGGVDATDVIDGVDALVATGRVDGSAVAVTGNSYGGYMAAWLAATSDRFAAAIARSPVTDWVSQHLTSNVPGFDRLFLHDDELAADSDYRRRSPLYRAADVRTPILLVAGANDLATPPEQAAMLHRAIVERGGDSTLVVYPQEGHGVRAPVAELDLLTRIAVYLDRHLAGGR